MASSGSTSVCSLYFCACSWQRMLLYSSSWLCSTGILLSAISFSWLEENNVYRNISFTLLKTVKRNCYWKQTIKAIRKWQKTHRKLISEPREMPCGMTLWIKDIIWQCCKSTAYVEIRPYGCSCSHLPPANKCEHSHSHWWESPNFHPVHSNLFYLQIFTPSCPFQTRFMSANSHTSCQLLLRREHSYSTTCAPALSGANTHAGMYPTNTVPLLLPTSVFQS